MDKYVRSFTTWEMGRALVIGFVTRWGSYREMALALDKSRSPIVTI